MTTMPDFHSSPTIINYNEQPAKVPPILLSGPLAWIRTNLFGSVFDTILTLVAVSIIIGVVTSFFTWVTTQANWWIINFNFRQIMLGRYDQAHEWRISIVALFVAFVVGFGIATWLPRFPRFLFILVLILLVLSFVVPPIVNATLPLPTTYFAAGNLETVSGSEKKLPQDRLAFVAQAGDTISVRLATQFSAGDASLAQMSGFADEASNNLRNAAANRLNTQARIAEIQTELAGDLLTSNQRAKLQEELEKLIVPDPVLDTYKINQVPVQVRVINGKTLEVVGEERLSPESDLFTVKVPDTGWYVIEKILPEGEEGISILAVQNIYPILLRNVVRPGVGQVEQYERMFNRFFTEDERPEVDGTEPPIANIINNQFRGTGVFTDFTRLFVGPFFAQINVGLLLVVFAVVAGYFASKQADVWLVRDGVPQRPSLRIAMWLLGLIPIVMFILISGVGNILPVTDTRLWGGLMLTFMLTVVGIIGSFPIGILLALGRRSSLPIVKLFCTLYIEFVRGVPLITVLFMAQLMVPLINPVLAEVDNVIRAMIAIVLFSAAYLAENVRGGLQSIPPGQEEAAKAVGLANWQIIIFITLPQALRAVIPALVGQFISLFKDTSLVAIVGLIDMTGMAQISVTQTEFLGLRREVYVFIILIYFSFSYVMSYISRRIEASGAGAARRI